MRFIYGISVDSQVKLKTLVVCQNLQIEIYFLIFNGFHNCPNPVIGSEELGFINIFSIAILVTGGIIASSFLIRRKGNDIT